MAVEIDTLNNQRHLFDIPEDVAYLNCAYMSPLMHSVVEAGEAAVARKKHPWTISPPDFFDPPDRARDLFGGLIGASADDIAIVSSVSYGMAVAGLNIDVATGQEILILEDQFPSNVYPWIDKARAGQAGLVTIPRTGSDDSVSLTDRLLDAIGPQTALIALPHCHWIDGQKIDLIAIGKAARAEGAALVLDVTQSAGVMPIDVRQVKPDFLVAASYKWLLGPYSMGYLYVAPERQNGQPLEHNWTHRRGAEDFSRLIEYQDDFAPGARRFDMGERSQLHLLPMAVRALEQIAEWGVDRIAATLALKTRTIADRAAQLGLRSTAEDQRGPHYLGLQFPEGLPKGIHQQLADHHVHVSIRGDRMRVTPHLYNHETDIDRLIETLRAVIQAI